VRGGPQALTDRLWAVACRPEARQVQLLEVALQHLLHVLVLLHRRPPCLATGRGEVLEPVNLSLTGYKILLINPGIHIHTTEAFKQVRPALPVKKIKEIIQQPVQTWKDELENDFEKIVFRKYPELEKVKRIVYKSGAVYASMSGSGSTVFGIFKKDAVINYPFEGAYFYKLLDVV